jgi:hypothetical protein
MNLIKYLFYCGNLEFGSAKSNIVNFVVYRFKDIYLKIVSLFNSHPLINRLDF